MTAALWFESHDRLVGESVVGPYHVFTAFMGLEHGFDDKGLPILFQTLVYRIETLGNKWMRYEERYATWDEAVIGHTKAVKLYARRAKRLKSDRT